MGAGSPGEVSCGRPRRAEPERPRRQGRRHGRGTDGSHSLTNAPVPEVALPPQQVEELMQVLSKGIRATQLYLPNNPVYQRAVDNIRAAFRQIWQATDDLVFDVGESELRWEDNVVYNQDQRNESIAWTLYKDGVRSIAFKPGVEEAEIVRFLGVLQRARSLQADAADDLLTLLWAQDFIPYLLGAADFRSVALILREAHVILTRARELIPEHRQALEALPSRLSQHDALSQLLQSLDEATLHPSEAELSELFQELRAEALTTLMMWIPKLHDEQ